MRSVAARQMHLFEPPRPLLARLGESFFRAAPREPGVYIMTGTNERVLYIGQSKNLRARLGSYKNAQPDRASPKVVRLVRLVESIVWEKCRSAHEARLRENELLRLHLPKFNAVNTYPKAYSFIWLRHDGCELELGRTNEPSGAGAQASACPPEAQFYGAFKTCALAGYAALLRLIWAGLHQPASPHDWPAQLLSARPPRRYRICLKSDSGQISQEELLLALQSFLAGTSAQFLELITGALPGGATLSAFQLAMQTNDLELLQGFYRFGPKRNYELMARHQLRGRLICQEQLDDLLVM
jgi:predicted GIY-YIG superfamily endonuclease